MEKQRAIYRNRLVFGLLIFYTSAIFAAPRISPVQINLLEIQVAPNQKNLSHTEIKFELKIPNVPPKNVEVETPENQGNAIFKTLKKDSTNEGGTKLELWYEFMDGGNFQLSPLKVKINNRNFSIRFAEIEVEKNPRTEEPAVVVIFSNGVKISPEILSALQSDINLFTLPALSNIKFTVYVQYTNRIVHFDYEVPQKTILKNLKVYEQSENKKTDYSHKLIPVADFEWTPLAKGKCQIPKINLCVENYDGVEINLELPELFVTVTNSVTKEKKDVSENLFLKSFEENSEDFFAPDDINSWDIKSVCQRIDARRKLHRKIFFILLGVIVFVSLIFGILKIKSPFPYLFLSVSLIILLFYFSAVSKKQVSIFIGEELNSIPEEHSEKHIRMLKNSEVKVLKETELWYCIELNGNSGWTKKENVIFY